jgi:hypothetical protein
MKTENGKGGGDPGILLIMDLDLPHRHSDRRTKLFQDCHRKFNPDLLCPYHTDSIQIKSLEKVGSDDSKYKLIQNVNCL